VAFDKSKAIAAAQKLVAQGKVREAVNEYKQIYSKDPKDQNVLNTLGDLYVRLNRLPEALEYYIKLADMYAGEGFLVRGIAMYKKISKLEPANTHALARLADLYTMQGMLADARSHYMQLVDAHLRANQANQAIEALHKVLDLDPDNVKLQQRLAELYERHGQGKQAAGIYRRLGEHSLAQGDSQESNKWMQKAVALAPESADVLLAQARMQQQAGQAGEALATLEKVSNLEENPEALELLLSAQLDTGNAQAAEELADKLFSANPNQFAGFLQLARHAAGQQDGERAVALLERVFEPALKGDPLCLLEVMREVTSLLPDSAQALELFVRAARQAQMQNALVEALSRQAQAASQQGDFARAKGLYDELVSLEPQNPEFTRQLRQARQELGEDVGVEAPVAEAPAPALDIAPQIELDEETQAFVDSTTNDIDLFSSYGMTDKAIELALQLLERVPGHIAGNEKLLDLYIGAGNDVGVVEVGTRLELLHRRVNNPQRAEEVANLARGYAEKAGVPLPGAAVAAPAAAPPEAVAEAPAEELLPEAPVEARFEIPVEAAAEPEAEAIHEVDLSSEWAMASGMEEAATEVAPAEAEPAEAPAFNAGEAEGEIDFFLAQGMVDQAREAVARYEEQFSDQPAVAELRARVEAAASAAAEPAEAVPAAEEGETYEVVLEEQAAQAAPAGAPMSAQDFFSDLAGELDQALEGAPAPPPARAAPPPPPRAAAPAKAAPPAPEAAPTGVLAEVFAEFKEEMGDVEEVEDIESHYNLGIAYKEMGLVDEAISEFQKVSKAAEHQKAHSQLFQACTLLGLCFLDKGHPQIAVRWYERALKAPGVDEEGALALRYDMGVAHEQAGNRKAALDCFMEVYGVNVDYRDVGDRIRELQGN
jgi:tetratricopeptide (TPR) repeat protein